MARFLLAGIGTYVVASLLAGTLGRRDPGTIDDVMRFTGPVFGIVLVATGLTTLVLALRSIFVLRQRNAVVWLGLAFGLFVALFLFGEVFLPH